MDTKILALIPLNLGLYLKRFRINLGEKTMRILSLILASFVAASFGSAAQAQQGVSLGSGLTDFTAWNLAGSATANNQTPGNGFTYSNLVLTASGSGDQAGSGFAPAPLSMNFNQAFSFDFHFFIPVSNQTRGDGLTFTMSDIAFLGNGGSGLGYEDGSVNSVAFAIDTFHFDGEPVSPSLQILQAGSVTPLAYFETGLGDTIRDPAFQWNAFVSYTPSGQSNNKGTFTGRIERPDQGNYAVSYTVDFSGLAGHQVYYGFTASNGLATDGHWVTSAAPVPEPETYAMMLVGLGLISWIGRRRKQQRT